MKHCANCNLDFPPDKKFCRQCGAVLVEKKPQRGATRQATPPPPESEPKKTKNSRALLRAGSLIISCTLVGMALPLGGLGMLIGIMVGGALATHFYLKDDG